MKRYLLLVAVPSTLLVSLFAQNGPRQEGTIVRMRMAPCAPASHAFMTAMSGYSAPTSESCPEYVLVNSSVVYVIVGRNSDQLLPLAETTAFRLKNNQVLIRIDDARRESRFHVKAMMLRAEWEREEKIADAMASDATRLRLEAATPVEARQ